MSTATRPPVARPLRAALATLAAELPTDLRDERDIREYRRVGTVRGTTAAAIAARLDLRAAEDTAGGLPATIFRGEAPQVARVVFLHGGGLIAGDRFDGADVVARHGAELALETWTLEYPLAPEHRFDVMVDTVCAALADVSTGGLPVVLAGQSGGGGLAAAVALACRDRGTAPAGLLLVCPMLGRAATASGRQYADDPSWSAISNATAWDAALAGTGLVPPAERSDLAGLPPTYLDVGSAELFRDDVTAFAGRLWNSGCPAELHVWSGAFHASDCVDETPVVSVEAHRARAEWLRRLLADAV